MKTHSYKGFPAYFGARKEIYPKTLVTNDPNTPT